MSGRDRFDEHCAQTIVGEHTCEAASAQTDALRPLIGARSVATQDEPVSGVLFGELVAIAGDGCTPLVIYEGQPGSSALPAQTVLELQGAHIGRRVVLMFEGGNTSRPIVMGLLRGSDPWPLRDKPGQLEVDADGERLTINAKKQLVLRCGEASITLTEAGKVLIRGSYVLCRSTGMNRIEGGAVQIN